MKYKKQIQLIAAIVTLIVFPVITFYLMEAYTHNPFEEVRPWAQFFNILLFELLAWIFVSVTGKIQSGLRIELVTAMIYGIANAYVVRFRTNPIVPWDIFSWKTAASVASNYDFKPDDRGDACVSWNDRFTAVCKNRNAEVSIMEAADSGGSMLHRTGFVCQSATG